MSPSADNEGIGKLFVCYGLSGMSQHRKFSDKTRYYVTRTIFMTLQREAFYEFGACGAAKAPIAQPLPLGYAFPAIIANQDVRYPGAQSA
jgi:hypothetical protein